MIRTRSLRLSLIAGLFVLQLVVLAGVSYSVFARARRIAFASVRSDAEVRAKTLSGVLERDRNGHEFDLDPTAVEEYGTVGEPVFASVVDSTGKVVVKSPSLGDAELIPDTPWVEGALDHAELVEGPYGIPCAAVTYSFLVRVDKGGTKPKPGREPWVPPTEAERRYQIRVAVDSRARDAELATVLGFLGAVDAAALLATLLGGLLLARWVLRPIDRMTADATRLDAADPTRRLEPTTIVSELRELAETLNGAFDRLHSALDRQRRFTADAGHELRTPVSILMSNADVLLRRERETGEYVEGLELQRRTAGRMHTLVEDLLTLARVDSGGSPLRVKPTDVASLLTDIESELTPVAASSGVSLDVATPDGAYVHCDANAMLRVLRNLVGNALKFTPSGGSVRVSVDGDGERVRIAVADSGPGIPESDRERVFERFHRVRDGQDRSEGTGLGLAIAQTLVIAQDGTISVGVSQEGGALLEVRLRRASPPTIGRDPVSRRRPASRVTTDG